MNGLKVTQKNRYLAVACVHLRGKPARRRTTMQRLSDIYQSAKNNYMIAESTRKINQHDNAPTFRPLGELQQPIDANQNGQGKILQAQG